jgi:small subunit ribosomal protein S20
MAQHASAEKQARKAVKHEARNRHWTSLMKTTVKRVRETKEKDKAQLALKKASRLLDQLASKGIIHKNKAANQKSRLSKYVLGLK